MVDVSLNENADLLSAIDEIGAALGRERFDVRLVDGSEFPHKLGPEGQKKGARFQARCDTQMAEGATAREALSNLYSHLRGCAERVIARDRARIARLEEALARTVPPVTP